MKSGSLTTSGGHRLICVWEGTSMFNSRSLAAIHHDQILRAQNVSDFRIFASRYPPRSVLPKHTHDQACIGFVLGGTCDESVGNRILTLSHHSLFFRPASEIHANRCGSAGARFLIAEVPERWLRRVSQHAALPDGPICVQGAELSWLALRLYQEVRVGGPASSLVIEGLMLEIAAGLVRRQKAAKHGHRPLWLERTRDALHAHYREALRLGTLAGWAGVHPVHLAREFRRRYGCSVGQYVRRLRVESGCGALANTDSSLASIAMATGFANQAHFSRVFKSVTGMSPAVYRASLPGANLRHNASIVKDTRREVR